MTPAFISAMLRRMSAAYDEGSETQHKVWRAAPHLAATYLMEQTATWPFEVDDGDRQALAERFVRALVNDEI
ncbi:hypothetical protein IQ17_04088 [Bradyrhizobium daqingense]|uniref:Uncharacterized protein n=1 Tax=Bradyrhizobium daqingense TaxID=993502 RepID=A0A562L4E6_9BRAD|nr:hypothetical protein IQ17_04088 [Bradyrhizobium daqingense]